MLLGVALGIFYVVSLIIAFMLGYGWGHPTDTDE